MKKRSAAVVSLLGLVGAAVGVRLWAPGLLDPDRAVTALRELPFLTQLTAFAGVYLLLTSVWVPALALHFAAGVAFGWERGSILVLVAANFASNLHFLAGRTLRSARLSQWLAQYRLGQWLQNASVASLVALRTVPAPFAAVNMACGAAQIPWSTFALGSGLGLLPVSLTHTFFAAKVYSGAQSARWEAVAWATSGGLALVTLAFLSAWLRKRLSPRASAP